jgi:tetratricopeptide (TPR) repeat protein
LVKIFGHFRNSREHSLSIFVHGKMTKRKQIKSKKQFDAALDLEKSGDISEAIKLYQKAVSTDPLNTKAWNKQMILYRKSKTKAEEIELIKMAIDEYKKLVEIQHKDWLITNKAKADDTRELAKVLGLLEPNGVPHSEDTPLEQWKTRLYLLEYRLKNARKKKTANNSTKKIQTNK